MALPGDAMATRSFDSPYTGVEETDTVDYGGIVHHPSGGYFSTPVSDNRVPVCRFDDAFDLELIVVHLGELLDDPTSYAGVPERADGERAMEILEYLDNLSERSGTTIDIDGNTGYVYPD